MDKYLPERKATRLPDFDYSRAGLYFVTIVTNNRACLFGEISDSNMHENIIGNITHSCWLNLPDHYSNIRLDEFIIMPNHFHGIIELHEITVGAGLRPARSKRDMMYGDGEGRRPAPTIKRYNLSTIIGSFKSYSSNRINILKNSRGVKNWQRSFHERIIRNDDELNRIREYIQNNPAKWQDDELYIT